MQVREVREDMKDIHAASLGSGENRWCYDITAVLQRLFSTNVNLSDRLAVITASVVVSAQFLRSSNNLTPTVSDFKKFDPCGMSPIRLKFSFSNTDFTISHSKVCM